MDGLLVVEYLRGPVGHGQKKISHRKKTGNMGWSFVKALGQVARHEMVPFMKSQIDTPTDYKFSTVDCTIC